MDKIARSLGTHDGSFHADEVVACALLLLFNLIDMDKIVRTRDEERLEQCEYVCDVGGVYDKQTKRFDHHQAEYSGLLSSAGMIWLYLKEEGVADQGLYDFFNHALILGVDAHDTGLSPQIDGLCTFSHVISNFLPPEYDPPPQEQARAFFSALEFARGHLQRLKERYRAIFRAREKMQKAMETGREYLLLDEALPWLENFFALGGERHSALFLVMPVGGHWKLRALPPTLLRRMEVRSFLPEEWAGLHDKELRRASGIPGAIFCHKGRFTSVWETKEDALKALEIVLKRRS
ncbi:MAG: hypothetical protein A2Y28_01285 [Chlamydiae bacterium GWC2_50_10]|nr:MAG: hypothetical protein A2Z85_01330 [Chlamydiae bacterium GWA2_50_15]OGN53825.1 MAG: hypothetical protein A2Y28_01285 [Chlamydiae bacterium GWC2_50_10]OGN58344.1 MAG: hypothetical protein A3D18_00295 [Chlamydiae bacterium RIFCSPHIGHO2_02_FULL_49_29]OGN64153.1 MAG: hypothetical protein A3E26_03060 [Chlamydiae bacterium RIFCSPHIGHO2_12_FULL_49_32]OGN68207.1 MAG: hypothetical protein A3I15_04990 [Chlamydiae bacterium RIFCSPLOWO2_02_FULL_49_12]OGN72898.1 MAG: hypothetical protein A3G30_01805 